MLRRDHTKSGIWLSGGEENARFANIYAASKTKNPAHSEAVSRIAAFIKLFEYCSGDAVGGDGQRLLICSVIGELKASFAVGSIDSKRVSAVDTVEGESALFGVVDYYNNDLSVRSEVGGSV